MNPIVVEVFGLHTREQLPQLEKLKKANPAFKATVYARPNMLGRIKEWKAEYPWLEFAMEGWEGSHWECQTWGIDQASWNFDHGIRELGYAPIFYPPNQTFDNDLLEAAEMNGILLRLGQGAELNCAALVGQPEGYYFAPLALTPGYRHPRVHEQRYEALAQQDREFRFVSEVACEISSDHGNVAAASTD